MELILIRHADAVPLGENGITDDEQRPLSDKGRKQSKALGKLLKKRDIAFDLVLCSPLLRARETVELALQAADRQGMQVEFTSALEPDARPKKLSRELLKVRAERVALVGHQPHLGRLAAWLVGDKNAQIEFAKAGMAQIACGDSPIKGNGALQWLITPDWFD